MDTLYWTKLNPDIEVKPVTRNFYGQYFYKLEVEAVGVSVLRYPDQTIAEHVSIRQRRSINYGGSWVNRRMKLPTIDEIAILHLIRQVQKDFETRLKFRVEEPRLSVYSYNEKDLLDFARSIQHNSNQHLARIHRPATAQILKTIQEGFVVKNGPVEYPFRVNVREGRYAVETKKQILSYLQNLGSDVHVPGHLAGMLAKPFDTIWGGYFYIKDRGIITMLSLISPGFVRSIEEYRQIEPDK
jgi:hypothetical protein